jgi:hypothetical protein
VSAESLQRALSELGIDCKVEAREKLAVIVPRDAPANLRDAPTRRAALALLAEHGFTHLALEIAESSSDDAPVSRD